MCDHFMPVRFLYYIQGRTHQYNERRIDSCAVLLSNGCAGLPGNGCGGGPHIYNQYTTARSAFSSSGSENNYSFKYDYTLFEAKRYLYLGQLTAILLLQGGQGLPVLCNSVVHYVLSDTIPSVVDDLTEQMKESFKKVMHINVA